MFVRTTAGLASTSSQSLGEVLVIFDTRPVLGAKQLPGYLAPGQHMNVLDNVEPTYIRYAWERRGY